MIIRPIVRGFAVLLLLTVGCGDRGCSGKEKATLPAVSSDVLVTVEHEGKPSVRIDSALLARTPPDFVDPPWRGWILTKLVPDWDTSAAIDIDDDEGFRSPLVRPGERTDGTDPVLLVGPDGETRVIRLAHGRPITAHQGAARRDSGRVRHVRRIRLRSEESARSDRNPKAASPISVKVRIGDTTATWTRRELANVKPISLMSKDGDGERDAWSLRDLATTLVAPGAVVVKAVGEDDAVAVLDEKKWKDEKLVPVLRANRRGRLKLVWLRADLEETEGEQQLRGVTEIEVRRAP